MKKTDEILKATSLGTSREILKQLTKKPMTVKELRKRSKKLRNRVSFYKSLNRMAKLNIVRRRHHPEVMGFVYELCKAKVVIDLRCGKVEVV